MTDLQVAFLKDSWMKGRNKLGGQNKVPRLSNTREYIEAIEQYSNPVKAN